MKIFSRLFCKTVFAALLTSYSLQGFEAKTLANDLGNLNSQLEQLAHKMGCQKTGPFLSQLHLPEIICILDENINSAAPSRKNLEAFAKETCIEVVQLVVAWQDLSTQSFLANPNPLNEALGEELGYKNNSIITCMKKNAFNTILEENIKLYKKEETDFKLSADFLAASIGGGWASCGYHTILHLHTLRDALQKTTPAKTTDELTKLTDLFEVNKRFGLTDVVQELNKIFEKTDQTRVIKGGWREEIIKDDKDIGGYSNANGEWLKSPAMISLATQHLSDDNGTFISTFHDHAVKQSGQTIEPTHARRITEIYQEEIQKHLRSYDEELQGYRLSKPKRCAYMVNTQNAHWYGIFVTLDTTPKLCIIVDSKNTPRYHQGPLREILKGFFYEDSKQIDESINNYFASKAMSAQQTENIDRLEAFQAVAALPDAMDAIASLKTQAEIKTFSERELRYIFASFVSLEPARKYFKNYDAFKATLQKMKKGEEVKLENDIRDPLKLLL